MNLGLHNLYLGEQTISRGALVIRQRNSPKDSQRLSDARRLRREMTDVEGKLWRHLRARRFKGTKFRRQHLIGPYVTDFCSIEAKLVVELDGGQHNLERSADAERTAYLKGRGYRVIRFWNDEVLKEMESVLDRIAAAIERNDT